MSNAFEMPQFSGDELPENVSLDQAAANRFTEATLQKHKREGLELAVRARWAALAASAVLVVYLNPSFSALFHLALLAVLAGIGWLQRKYGRVGRSRAELAVLALDLAVITFALTFPNPLNPLDWPSATYLRFDAFDFMYVILATGTLCYSWRTILAIGNWMAGMWFIAVGLIWYFGYRDEELGAAAQAVFGHDETLWELFDPNSIHFDMRLQQIVVFVIVSGILAVSIRRFNRLLLGNAALERERANLARYFSPNVVEELSQNDEPLKQIRTHDVAAIFVDIKGFTAYAADRAPQEVIETLRSFHQMMERAIFAHGGTLDKFLGDGLMATFGTPLPAPGDARRAYHCTRRMVDLAEEWNQSRAEAGQPRLEVGIGLHYGPVVLGDIGGSRLEYAVIGNTVNIASRMEALSRPLNARLVISEAVHNRLPEEETSDMQRAEAQSIRGLDQQLTVWTLP